MRCLFAIMVLYAIVSLYTIYVNQLGPIGMFITYGISIGLVIAAVLEEWAYLEGIRAEANNQYTKE